MGSLNGTDQAFDAIVLAGGRATRFGGLDKTAVEVDGVRILDHVLGSVSSATHVSVVGPEVTGGPVAAIASALPHLAAPIVVTLAGDQPWVGPAVAILINELGGADVAVLVADGRRHYLAAAWRTSSLAAAVDELDSPENAPVRALFEGRSVVEVVDAGGWSRDVDSPEDLPG
jgi:molybdopterin-guanine dinucleotide biosynthesis protein A